MKKFLEIIGGLTLMSSFSTSVVSCQQQRAEEYILILFEEGGKPIDIFDKRNVKDYYFESWSNSYNVTEIVINFKNTGLKKYGSKSGDCAYWLGQLVEGLNQKPAQVLYKKEPIPEWAWKDAGLWDYEHDKPKN